MVGTEIKANQREAAQLFVRGVAAARGGQRRLAAVLLARVVQLDPQHEMGWLWLSGVLDDPKEIAFCLHSVLAINPQNERARRGLEWLESRRLLHGGNAEITAPFARAAPNGAEDTAANGNDGAIVATPPPMWRTRLIAFLFPAREPSREHTDSWWVGWRLSRQEMNRARVLLWSMPVLLLAFTLALNYALRVAMERNQMLIQAELAQRAVAAGEATLPTAEEPIVTVPAVLETTLMEERNAVTLAYLSRLEEPRARLRGAIESYRNATSRPGGSSIFHATSAQRLRDEIEQAYAAIAALQPPDTLVEAHALYLQGLELELTALDHMLSFYGSFRAEDANRAALTMAEATRRLDQARQAFERQQTELSGEIPQQHSVR